MFHKRSHQRLRALLLPAAAVTLLGAGTAHADHTITVKILSVEALDKVDELSGADFYARVTIAGETQKTSIVKGEDIKPGWSISKTVRPGRHDVKLELIDKDVAQDDPVDINRIDAKRDLDFNVNTRNCRIEGFAVPYRCGRTISRAGGEKKKADIAFEVTVERN